MISFTSFVYNNLKSSNFVNRWRCDGSKCGMLKVMCNKTVKCTLYSLKCTLNSIKLLKHENKLAF